MINLFILWSQLFLLLIVTAIYFIFSNYINVSYYIPLISFIIILSTILFSIREKSKCLRKNFLTTTFLFLLSFLIVHFQLYLDYSLGLRSDLSLSYYLDYNILPKSISIVAIALNCFYIGNIYSTLNTPSPSLVKHNKYHEFSDIFLFTLTVSFFLMFLYVTPMEYFQGSYGKASEIGGVSNLQQKSNHYFLISAWAYIISRAIKNTSRKINFREFIISLGLPFLCVLLPYYFLIILSGDRGPIIYTTVITYGAYLVTQQKSLNFKKMILIVVIAGSFIQFLGYFRVTDGSVPISERIESTFVVKERLDSRNETTISPPTLELAASLRAYHAAVMDQEYNDKLYGMTHLGSIIGIIPGLGQLLMSLTSLDFSSSAVYITEKMGADHGMGTTVLADIYLNYGILGVVLVFYFFGYLFANLDYRAYSDFKNESLFFKVLFLVYLSYGIYIGRATFLFVFIDVTLVYFILVISSSFNKIFKSKYKLK